jgi:hypothetical protein
MNSSGTFTIEMIRARNYFVRCIDLQYDTTLESSVGIDRRPDLGQEISKEAVAKAPELVRATAPGAE